MSLAGSFLVARHSLRDPNFAQTVVLLLAHNDEGAFGLVVNRPAQAEGVPFPVFIGGPCPSSGVVIIHGHSEWVEAPAVPSESPAQPEIVPGVFVGDASCLTRASDLAEGEARRFRVFRGYSGWGGGQLEQELAGGAWAVTPATAQALFDTPIEDLWLELAPPSLPQPSLN